MDLKVNISYMIFNIKLAVIYPVKYVYIFYTSNGLGSNLILEFMFPREIFPFNHLKLTFLAMLKIKPSLDWLHWALALMLFLTIHLSMNIIENLSQTQSIGEKMQTYLSFFELPSINCTGSAKEIWQHLSFFGTVPLTCWLNLNFHFSVVYLHKAW